MEWSRASLSPRTSRVQSIVAKVVRSGAGCQMCPLDEVGAWEVRVSLDSDQDVPTLLRLACIVGHHSRHPLKRYVDIVG